MAWLNNNWQYRKSHVVNSATGAGTGYQIKLTVHYGAGTDSGSDVYLDGKCETDFSDLRFTDDDETTQLDYWIQEKTDSDHAVVWVKIADDISSSNATIYLYYGNSGATDASNGTNVFEYFEDFESGYGIWDVSQDGVISTDQNFEPGGSQSVKFVGASGNTLEKNTTFPSSGLYAIRRWFYFTGDFQGHIFAYKPSWTGTHLAFGRTGNTYPDNAGTLAYHNGSSWTVTSYHHPDNQWVEIEVIFNLDNGTFDCYVDGSQEINGGGMFGNPAGQTTDEEGLHIDGTSVPDAYVDTTLARKYVSPEPANGTWGSEEVNATHSISVDHVEFTFSESVTTESTTKSMTYVIETTGLEQKSLTYETQNNQSITKSLSYEALTDNVIAKSLTYKVTSKPSITKSLTYAVQSTACISGGFSGAFSDWSYRRKITIDSAQIDSDLTGFPVYVDLSAITGISNPDGIRVTESDGTTEVAREIVSANQMYFKGDPTAASDTDYYIYYGNAGASDYADNDTYGKHNVWTNGFEAVYHLEASGAIDATSNSVDGTDNGSIAETGKLGSAKRFNGSTDEIDFAGPHKLTETAWTVSAWSKSDTFSNWQNIVGSSTPENNYLRPGGYLCVDEDGRLRDYDGSWIFSNSSLTLGTWHYVVFQHSTAQVYKMYIDGSLDKTKDPSIASQNRDGEYWIDKIGQFGGGVGRYFDGVIDEVRVSSVMRSADWISVEYTNQNTPNTFYSIGSEEEGCSPIQKSLTYEITQETTESKVKSLTYTVFTTNADTKSLTYETQTSDAITKSLNYEVETTPQIIKSLDYQVVVKDSKQKSLTYYVQPSTLSEKEVQYKVHTSSVSDKSLTYELESVENLTKSLQYGIETTDILTKSLTYYIAETNSKQKSLEYYVRQIKTIENELTYYTRLIENKPKSLKYTVLSTDSKVKSLTYEPQVSDAIQKSLQYTVPNTPAPIEKALNYHVQTSELIQSALEYQVQASNFKAKGMKYTVPSTDDVTKTLAYEIQSATAIQKSLTYAVEISASIQKGLTYSVVTKDTKTKGLKYTVIPSVSAQHELQYAVTSTYSPLEKSLHYEALTADSIVKSLNYQVETVSQITKGLEYHVITTQPEVEKSLEYQVQSPVGEQKGLTYTVQSPESEVKSLEYYVSALNAIQKSLQYTVETTKPAITKSLVYTIIEAKKTVKELSYAVRITETTAKSLSYSVQTEISSLQLSLTYTVETTKEPIIKSLTYEILNIDYYRDGQYFSDGKISRDSGYSNESGYFKDGKHFSI